MAERLTYEFIKASFEREGYKLLSKDYTHSKHKLESLCPNGHLYEVSANHWLSLGSRCKTCDRTKGPNIDLVRASFSSEGYTLLSDEYNGNKVKLHYKCPVGHRHSITWGHWNTSKARCPYCSGKMKYKIEDVRPHFEVVGYTLLSKEYESINSRLEFICDKGHRNTTSFAMIKNGHICSICANNVKRDLSYIREAMLSKGYTLLSEVYDNNKSVLEVMCNKGHTFRTKWNSWKSGRRCPVCKGINISINRTGPGHPNWQGGKSFEVYCSEWKDKEYKKEIKERDGQICINPYCSKTDKVLSIHHVDYNKKNCRPNNLITVCRSCNAKANYDREWHMAWYRALLKNRYGYRY